MTEYEPKLPPEPPPSDDVLHFVGFVLFVALCVALLTKCSDEAQAQIPPFLLLLPDGTQQQACAAAYDPTAKQFNFDPCIQIFGNGFEGGEL